LLSFLFRLWMMICECACAGYSHLGEAMQQAGNARKYEEHNRFGKVSIIR
jgi:hypothetical protein